MRDINPDAIFGIIDPRESNMVQLSDMFQDGKESRHLNKGRGSSANRWNDTFEFATPNIVAANETGKYKIDHDNVNNIKCFNPFEIVTPA